MEIKEEWKTENGKYKCPVCKKDFKKHGICTHIWRVHGDGKRHDPNVGYKDNIREAWNKGLTKDSDSRVLKNTNSVKKKWESGTVTPRIPYTEEQRNSLNKNGKMGGLRKGAGRGKKGTYKGIHCDSTWELAWVIFNLDHKVNFKRNKIAFDYEYEGKNRKYYPDFYLPEEDCFIEIKGYRSALVEEKCRQFPATLILIEGDEIAPLIEYVKKTYDVINLEDLYER